jgi:hypothetical protein
MNWKYINYLGKILYYMEEKMNKMNIWVIVNYLIVVQIIYKKFS